MYSIWSIIASNVECMVNVSDLVCFMLAIAGGRIATISFCHSSISWIDVDILPNCSSSLSMPSSASKMLRSDQQIGMSKQCGSQ